MAFNKGLELNDGNGVNRDTIVLGGQSQALFQTQLVDGALQAHGAAVFTLRPDDNNDSAGEYQSLLVGQNFAIGLEYNEAGDQYRIVIQSREDYDNGGVALGAGTEDPAYGPYVATETETTFGINLNDNGTITYMHTGSGQQSLSIDGFTPDNASITIQEASTPDGSDVAHLILDDHRGNIIDVQAGDAGSADGDLMTELVDAFNLLTSEQQSGFQMSAVTNTDESTISRVDGAGFSIRAGDNHTAAHIENATGGTGDYPEEGDGLQIGMPDDYLFDLDFDGFVSQIATFNEPLTISELSGYVSQPSTIPSTAVNSDGEDARAIITIEGGAPQAGSDVTYEFELDDELGNSITGLSFTTVSTADTFADFATEIKSDFDGLADKAGFALDDSVSGQITFSRADGADFKVTSVAAASDYATTDDLEVNGVDLEDGDLTFSSSNIVSSTITVSEIATPAGADVGAVYELILDDGDGDDPVTLNDFLITTGTADGDAAGLFTGEADQDGFAFSASGNDLVITRTDGVNFTVKLGDNDEAANFKVGDDALTKDATIASTDGARSGVPDTISNKVVQKFDFTALDEASTVVSQSEDNYAGADTLIIYGMDKSDGTSLLALSDTNANAYDDVSSASYTGAVAVDDGAAAASNVLYAQLREVADSGVADRQFTADVFIDSNLITDGDFSALSYTVGWSTDLTIDSIVQADSTGGYKLEDIDVANDTADLRWFKPTAVTDFSAPIATLVFTDTTGSTDPTLTFSAVDVDGTDFTDGSTYTATFADTLDADLWDVGDVLVNGNDSTSAVADQLVVVEGALGGSSAAPAPTSGLYLKLDAFDQDASSDAPNVDYTLGVYSSTATNTVSFDIELPALADTSTDDLGVNATTFTLDAALADWTVTSAAVQGRTLVVEASGATSLTVGDSIGQVATTVTNGFDTTQYFEMANVQTDADAANENGRGLYVAATRTDSDGAWSVNDMPTGIITRDFVGTAEIAGTSVTALDAYYALQMSAGLQPNWWNGSFSEGQALAADFDGSGKVTASDALAILQYSVGTVPDPDPVEWVFFDSETTAITNAETVDNIASLASNTAVTASDLTLDQGDEVILVGDLSNPAV